MHLGQRLVVLRLHRAVVAKQGAHLAEHSGGLGAAVHRGGEVVEVGAGEAQAVPGVEFDADDVGGEAGLEGIGGMQGGDRLHGFVCALGANVGTVGGGRRESAAEGGVDLAGDRGGEVGKGVHAGGGPLAGCKALRWC